MENSSKFHVTSEKQHQFTLSDEKRKIEDIEDPPWKWHF